VSNDIPPPVSLLIPTHARVSWLEEALHCAINQDYEGSLEILVWNDCARQTLVCKYPRVSVVNEPTAATLGAKRHAMVEAANGEYVAWLDDDDLALPWYVTRLVRPLSATGARAVVSRRCYALENQNWGLNAVAIEVLCHRRRALEVGYPESDSGEDQDFRGRLEAAGDVSTILDMPGGYVYRWAQGTYHISGNSTPNEGESFRRDATRRIDEGSEPQGIIELRPRLRRNYFRNAPGELRDMLRAPFIPTLSGATSVAG
jgi:glycosyltransferase involved in cell wall biosynthesis